jgi:hypothetical protein
MVMANFKTSNSNSAVTDNSQSLKQDQFRDTELNSSVICSYGNALLICKLHRFYALFKSLMFISVISLMLVLLTGRWWNGKLQGPGKLEWPDGKVYMGQFQNSQMNGTGYMEIPGISTYDGQWKDGQQDGYGIMK